MNQSKQELWQRFQKYYSDYPVLGLALDLSRMHLSDDYCSKMEPRLRQALSAMHELERGARANPDENRMVGHYWLRNPALAPTSEIRGEIEQTVAAIKQFAGDVHSGRVAGERGVFRNLLVIGIGGSALGPQFVSRALGHPHRDKLRFFSFDNTDPDGMDRVLAEIGGTLGQTLCIVISKSGGTKETRNGMLEARNAYEAAGLNFARHAVAITQAGSELDTLAARDGWRARFPMWDWVGGRTSELSAVGLVPASLQGIDIDGLLLGAKACDDLTRDHNVNANPAARIALAWHAAGNGKGDKNLVVLPYKDRLEFISKYLQQLIMESLGKEHDLAGNVVHQGLFVFGNKGSTDQHSYIQQLRDGLPNFFVTFIEVLKHRETPSMHVEPDITSGDYLFGFLMGTRQALYENGRQSMSLLISDVTAFSVGVLIALFERVVGLYANLIGVNAYHQPGVEAGKKAAAEIIQLELEVLRWFTEHRNVDATAPEIADALSHKDDVENVFMICEHLSANPERGIQKTGNGLPGKAIYRWQC